jgi:hypothetical protein
MDMCGAERPLLGGGGPVMDGWKKIGNNTQKGEW